MRAQVQFVIDGVHAHEYDKCMHSCRFVPLLRYKIYTYSPLMNNVTRTMP